MAKETSARLALEKFGERFKIPPELCHIIQTPLSSPAVQPLEKIHAGVRLWGFKDELIPNVSNMLRTAGLLCSDGQKPVDGRNKHGRMEHIHKARGLSLEFKLTNQDTAKILPAQGTNKRAALGARPLFYLQSKMATTKKKLRNFTTSSHNPNLWELVGYGTEKLLPITRTFGNLWDKLLSVRRWKRGRGKKTEAAK